MFFEIGESYTVKMWEPGKDGGTMEEYFGMQVLEVALPLVTFVHVETRVAINTSSPGFVSATAEKPWPHAVVGVVGVQFVADAHPGHLAVPGAPLGGFW
jgi:hypothetical protein